MPKFLLIESSGDVCSVAVSSDSDIIAEMSIQEKNSHSTYLASFVDEVLQRSSFKVSDLDAVVIGGGPGSYTGLRIGCSLAKGLCFGADIPLIACSTLQAIAVSALEISPDLEQVITLIDARRMDAYVAVYDAKLMVVKNEHFATLDSQLVVDYINGHTGLAGSGAAKWIEEFDADIVVCFTESALYARNLLPEASKKWLSKSFEDVAYYEPNYIKSVFVTKPKPKF